MRGVHCVEELWVFIYFKFELFQSNFDRVPILSWKSLKTSSFAKRSEVLNLTREIHGPVTVVTLKKVTKTSWEKIDKATRERKPFPHFNFNQFIFSLFPSVGNEELAKYLNPASKSVSFRLKDHEGSFIYANSYQGNLFLYFICKLFLFVENLVQTEFFVNHFIVFFISFCENIFWSLLRSVSFSAFP